MTTENLCRATRYVFNFLLFIFNCWTELCLKLKRTSSEMQQFGSLKLSSGFHSMAGFWSNTHLGLNLEARFISETNPLMLSALYISQASPAPLRSPSKALHPELPLLQCGLMPPQLPGALVSALRSADAKWFWKCCSRDFRYWRALENLAAHCAALVQGQLDKVSRDVKSSHCLVCHQVL